MLILIFFGSEALKTTLPESIEIVISLIDLSFKCY